MECQCPTRLATVIFTIVFIVMLSISGFRLSGDISKIISKLQHLSSPPVYSVTKTECSYHAMLHENHKDIYFPILSNINITQYITSKKNISRVYKTIVNKTLAFVGDSTLHAQYYTLCYTIGGRFLGNLEFTSIDNSSLYQRFQQDCYSSSLNITLKFRGVGRISKWAVLPAPHVVVNETIQELTKHDILIFNIGVHYMHWCKVKSKELLSEVISRAYETALQDILRTLSTNGYKSTNNVQNETKNVVSAGSSDALSGDLPQLIWRDTLPQHFNTSNGEYINKVDKIWRQYFNTNQHCVPMSHAMFDGRAIPGVCIPNCLPANWRNHISDPIIHNHPYLLHLKLYDDFIHLSEYHPDKDCTHYNKEANEFANLKLIDMIAAAHMGRDSTS